ncbi:MAG: DUF1501 domain-containing protein [Myxococcus sp.]|nr:DUF1501 domain-containing protein [Myxococcus sp.]
MSRFSRRQLFQSFAGVAGGALAAKAGLWPSTAFAQTAEKPALLVVFLQGGYNSLFSSANSYATAGTFGVTAGNQRDLGNGLVVDAPTFGTLPAYALSHMATVGVRHGISNHGAAQAACFSDGGRSYALRLAAELGGDASIKCAQLGTRGVPGPRPMESGVSMQVITDMRTTIEALGGSTDPTRPDRVAAAKALQGTYAMSAQTLFKSPAMTRQLGEGYSAAIETLEQPVKQFSFADLATAYGLANNSTTVNNFSAQMAAAELMITSGTNVVVAMDGGWDTHGDRTGTNVRNMMTSRILPGLRTFISRMVNAPDRNVVVAIMGDFARSLPGSDHASALSATVIGKYVKVGTTGKMSDRVQLAAGTPSAPGLWSYLGRVLNAPTPMFGANPHTSLVL